MLTGKVLTGIWPEDSLADDFAAVWKQQGNALTLALPPKTDSTENAASLSCKDKDVILISTLNGACTRNDCAMRVLLTARKAKCGGANRVILVEPYPLFGFGNDQDADLYGDLLRASGVDGVATTHIPSDSVQKTLQQKFNGQFVELSPVKLYAALLTRHLQTAASGTRNFILCAPGKDAIPFVHQIYDAIGTSFTKATPHTLPQLLLLDRHDGNILADPASPLTPEQCRGKEVVCIDFAVHTGRTLAECSRLLKKNGASRITWLATHFRIDQGGVSLFNDSPVDQVITTDTIPALLREDTRKQFHKKILVVQIGQWLAQQLDEQMFSSSKKSAYPRVDKAGIARSVELACTYMLNSQKEKGNFIYSLDLRTGRVDETDNQVRQAGAVWAVALLNREKPADTTLCALRRGLDFFADCVTVLPDGSQCLVYPDTQEIRTGTVAIYCLALLDFLIQQKDSADKQEQEKYGNLLKLHLEYLRSRELPNGSWSKSYNLAANSCMTESSPYFDGECLLAYCRAARQLHRQDLQDHVEKILPRLLARYTTDCWKTNSHPELTKGFFQWSCMACAEYLEAGWTKHAELAANTALAISAWMLNKIGLLRTVSNIGYALEGMVAAWRCAKYLGREDIAQQLRKICMTIMDHLAPMQFMGPYMQYNPDFRTLKNAPETAQGGIVSSLGKLDVRIDTVQHQIHGMLLMLKYLF